MSAYDDDADRLAEHVTEECDDPFCQICWEDDLLVPVDPSDFEIKGPK